jgi:hypothetical protein
MPEARKHEQTVAELQALANEAQIDHGDGHVAIEAQRAVKAARAGSVPPVDDSTRSQYIGGPSQGAIGHKSPLAREGRVG